MKHRIRFLGAATLLVASSAAFAAGHISININPFGWGEAPPVVYESPRYYAPPPAVYYGHGQWGDHRDVKEREHHRGRSNHHDDGDHRR